MACGNLVERLEQCLVIETVGSGVEIGIGFDLESCGTEYFGVVGPGWFADPDRFIAEVSSEEVACDAQGAGASRALYGDRAF